ncbi:hypothetical protein [Massiliimalia timonensis]|uniref:hypothetical protein n=1 Tax=Massiliimalia timonensis TaxID=1987501 RepID=UPI00189E9CEB|nr:hypothetical protein [Massiliimalia timonensis]
MDETTQLYQFIYENATMGKDTVKHLLTVTEEKEMETLLTDQLSEYSDISEKARKALEQRKVEAQKIGPLTKMSTDLMINFNLIKDRSASHMAEMMTQGSTMGIVEITKQLKDFPKADDSAKRLGNKLLKMEEHNIDQLKAYL